jgi:hypothetical protein
MGSSAKNINDVQAQMFNQDVNLHRAIPGIFSGKKLLMPGFQKKLGSRTKRLQPQSASESVGLGVINNAIQHNNQLLKPSSPKSNKL